MAASVSPRRIASRLRSEIKRRNLSQYRIAKETGIKQPSLSRFLNGGSLKLETAAVLMEYLGFLLTAESPGGQQRLGTKRRAAKSAHVA
jgi:transcriptional regulator with XRE-family HTH domain